MDLNSRLNVFVSNNCTLSINLSKLKLVLLNIKVTLKQPVTDLSLTAFFPVELFAYYVK